MVVQMENVGANRLNPAFKANVEVCFLFFPELVINVPRLYVLLVQKPEELNLPIGNGLEALYLILPVNYQLQRRPLHPAD